MTLDDLRNFDLKSVDLKNFSAAPLPAKIAAIVLVCFGILAGGYFFFLQGMLEQHETLKRKEAELRNAYLDKKAMAINLPAYKQQMEEMEITFSAMRRQLPSSTEIPDLLIDITQAGLGRGLEFELFKPEKEKPIDFYAELPISLKVKGTYHELAQFMSDVSALPRIVTIGEITLGGDKAGKLAMTAKAKTFRYMEEGTAPAKPKAAKK